MKAFLLAAGRGTRLRPLTDSTPKCLLPVRGRPLLAIWLEICRRSGITEVLLNVHAHAPLVQKFVSQLQGVPRVTVFEEPDLLGSSGTIAANRQWVSSESHFWVLYADVLTNVALPPMLAFHRTQSTAATIGVYRVPDPKRCGIVTVDGDHRVTDFVEKPANPTGNLAFSGVLIASKAMLDAIPDGAPADLGHDVLPRLTRQMSAYEIHDFLMDIGTLENYRQAQTAWPGLSFAAMIFDMDGVLANSHPTHRRAWRELLLETGRVVSEKDLDFVEEGRQLKEILVHFLGPLSAAELASYGERKQQLFSLAAAEIRAFPGVVELLRELQDAGIPRAVVTSASRSRAHALLAYTGLAPYFSIVVAAEDVAQGKPDPAAFRRAAELLNVPSQSCLVAEDSWAGVQGATMAGMNCLAIADGARAVRLLNAGAISAVPGFVGLTIRNLQDLFQRSGVDATFPVGNSEISCRRVAEEV